MKHFHVELERNGQLTRTWELWSDRIRIGSSIESDIVLPPPYDALVAECEEAPFGLEIPIGSERLRILEDTQIQQVRWASARERMELSRRLGWREPGANKDTTRRLVLGLMGVMGIAAMVGFVMVGRGPKAEATPEIQSVIELVQAAPEEKQPDPPPQDPVPQEQEAVSQEEPTPNPVGGATENTTVPKEKSVAQRMDDLSILNKINTNSDGAIGEAALDASSSNVVDGILSGKGGSLIKGNVGGHGASGNDGRMGEQGGIGFGYAGSAGVGPGFSSSHQGKDPTMGKGGKGIKTGPVHVVARPAAVDLEDNAGSRSAESILRVIRAHVGGFRYTYEKFLKENPAIGGKISLRFTISPSGDIVAIEVANSNTGIGSLDQEIKEKARRMKFDPIEKGNVTVTYAFVLDRQ